MIQLAEYERVLAELATKYPQVKYQRILELITIHTEIVPTLQFAKPVCKERDDDMFLGTALSGGAPYIVSGDKLLLDVNGFRGLRIVQPKAFLLEL